jgi:hypothetical protein
VRARRSYALCLSKEIVWQRGIVGEPRARCRNTVAGYLRSRAQVDDGAIEPSKAGAHRSKPISEHSARDLERPCPTRRDAVPVKTAAMLARKHQRDQASIPASFADSNHRRLATASSRAPAVGVAGRQL